MTGKEALFSDATVIDRDREFDQTALTETPGHVSPSILEYRIHKLEQDLKYERKRHGETQDDLRSAETRIKGFEQMVLNMSHSIDGIEADFILLTGKSWTEWLAAERAARAETEAAETETSELMCPQCCCVLPNGHKGRCAAI